MALSQLMVGRATHRLCASRRRAHHIALRVRLASDNKRLAWRQNLMMTSELQILSAHGDPHHIHK